MLQLGERRASEILFRHLVLQYLILEMNCSKNVYFQTPNQFWARFEILGDTLCKAAKAFLIETLHSDPSYSAIQQIPLQWFLTFFYYASLK